MILYTLQGNGYQDIKECQNYKDKTVYVNITNRCCCNCTFCLRQTKQMLESNSLWLSKEPTMEEIMEEFSQYSISDFKEIVFCGFGEPLTRVDTIVEISTYLKSRDSHCKIRINTNGLSSYTHQRDITVELEGLIDTISISLNAPTKEEYYQMTRSKYGMDSFDYMLEFTKACKKHIPEVVMSVVDIIGDKKIQQCQEICQQLGVILRIRPFEQ